MLLSILLLILSIFNIFIGTRVKERKLANLLSGFDEEKDDLEYVSSVLGNTFKWIGNLGTIITALYMILQNKISLGLYLITYVGIIVLFTVILTFKTDRHRRKNIKALK